MQQEKIFENLLLSLRKVYPHKNKFYNLHPPILDKNEKKILESCISSNYVSTAGKLIFKFEEKLKKITGAKYVICMSNGTSALHLGLKIIGVKENDEVLIPSFNFVASSHATLYLNAIPHYVDSDSKLGIDLNKLQTYLDENTVIKKICALT